MRPQRSRRRLRLLDENAQDAGLVRGQLDHRRRPLHVVRDPDHDHHEGDRLGEEGHDAEQDRVAGPPYWGKYVLHDNNRDINYSQVTMRALLDWYMTWKAPILHELHESIPFLYTYSGQAPQNPNLDPILYGEMPWFANFEMAQLTKYGMPGVWTHAFVDMWSPGYLAFMSSNHNGMVRMYETFGNGGATTICRISTKPIRKFQFFRSDIHGSGSAGFLAPGNFTNSAASFAKLR